MMKIKNGIIELEMADMPGRIVWIYSFPDDNWNGQQPLQFSAAH